MFNLFRLSSERIFSYPLRCAPDMYLGLSLLAFEYLGQFRIRFFICSEALFTSLLFVLRILRRVHGAGKIRLREKKSLRPRSSSLGRLFVQRGHD